MQSIILRLRKVRVNHGWRGTSNFGILICFYRRAVWRSTGKLPRAGR